ncbi:MAG: hypothetical protein HGB35_03970 [Geobacteraceae bacterium]|nr:hypothetical protein [Geobacteraceae bacterium]
MAFLKSRYRKKRVQAIKDEAADWSALGEASLRKVWDNEEDDVYNELLKR